MDVETGEDAGQSTGYDHIQVIDENVQRGSTCSLSSCKTENYENCWNTQASARKDSVTTVCSQDTADTEGGVDLDLSEQTSLKDCSDLFVAKQTLCYDYLLDIHHTLPLWGENEQNFYFHWRMIMKARQLKDFNPYKLLFRPLEQYRLDGYAGDIPYKIFKPIVRQLDEYRRLHDPYYISVDLETIINSTKSTPFTNSEVLLEIAKGLSNTTDLTREFLDDSYNNFGIDTEPPICSLDTLLNKQVAQEKLEKRNLTKHGNNGFLSDQDIGKNNIMNPSYINNKKNTDNSSYYDHRNSTKSKYCSNFRIDSIANQTPPQQSHGSSMLTRASKAVCQSTNLTRTRMKTKKSNEEKDLINSSTPEKTTKQCNSVFKDSAWTSQKGVYYDTARRLWRANWKENGRVRTKGFSVTQCGWVEARELAVKCRIQKEKEIAETKLAQRQNKDEKE